MAIYRETNEINIPDHKKMILLLYIILKFPSRLLLVVKICQLLTRPTKHHQKNQLAELVGIT